MLRNLAHLLVLVVLSSCTMSPRRGSYAGGYGGGTGSGTQTAGGATGGGGAQTGVPGATIDASNPRAAIEQVDQAMTRQGFRRVGDVLWNRNLTTGNMMAYEVPATPGSCYAIVAIAAPGSNLDLFVLGPDGNPLAADVGTDAHPSASFCHTAQGRVLARLQMAQGAGEYFYALYQVGAQPVNLAALFGGGTATAQAANLDPATTQRIETLDQQQAAERYQRALAPHGIQYTEGETREYRLNLRPGTCYRFAALAATGARDVNVTLVDAVGNQQVADTEARTDAMVQFCPALAGTYSLRTTMQAGAGPAFTVAYMQGAATTNGGTTNTAPAAPVLNTETRTAATLEENFRLLDADMRARGYETYGESRPGQLTTAQQQDFDINLEGGKCYAVLAVGDYGVHDLGLVLLDPRGREVDRDVAMDPRPIVRVCPSRSGDYKMRVDMSAGAGRFVYSAYRWPRGTRGPFGLSGVTYVRLAEVTSLLNVEGYEPDVDSEPGRGSLRSQGQARSHSVALRGGLCYSVVVVGGAGIHDLDVKLSRSGAQIAVDGTRSAFPNVRYCPPASETTELEVQAATGSGDYFYQVFRRSST